MRHKYVIITGAPGQDSYYLAELLSSEGYNVILTYKSFDAVRHRRVKIDSKAVKHEVLDVTNFDNCIKVISTYQPFAIFNGAAVSSITAAENNPQQAMSINCNGVFNLLETIRLCSKHTKFINLSSKEIFGKCYEIDNGKTIQTENTARCPTNLYGLSKNLAFETCDYYRDKYALWISSGILYNHESIFRPDTFLLKKIISWFNKYYKFTKLTKNKTNYLESNQKLKLGNLDIWLDISHAKDICRGLYKLSLSEKPDDYIFCSGKIIDGKSLVQKVAEFFEIENAEQFYEIDKSLFRKNQSINKINTGYQKAYYKLNWSPKFSLNDIIKEMAG